MISSCPPYYSSVASCLLRSHHYLLFRLVAFDCLSCSATFVRSVLSSSLALSFSMPLASCLHLLLSCMQFCWHSVCYSLPRGNFYLPVILRSLVAAVTPGHPNQSLCPVCAGVQRRELTFLTTVNDRNIIPGSELFKVQEWLVGWERRQVGQTINFSGDTFKLHNWSSCDFFFGWRVGAFFFSKGDTHRTYA